MFNITRNHIDHLTTKLANDNFNAAMIRSRADALEEYARNSIGDPDNEPYIHTTMAIVRQLRESLRAHTA